MDQGILKFLSDPTPVLSISQIIWGLFLSFGLSFLFSRYYHKYSLGLSSSPNFPHALVLISITACFIMSVVGNSLARAFSLAGALSIVRFRNALKETEEIAAIFLSMSIGIACGAGFYLLSCISVFLIMGFWLLLKSDKLHLKSPIYALVELESPASFSLAEELKGMKLRGLRSVNLLESSQTAIPGKTFQVYRVQLDGNKPHLYQELVSSLSQNENSGFKRLIPESTISQN